ncbi:MAG: hypothetical protein AB7I38_05290 [Dehalococcoidia bacterium]
MRVWGAFTFAAAAIAALAVGLFSLDSQLRPQRGPASAHAQGAPSCPGTLEGLVLIDSPGNGVVQTVNGEQQISCNYPANIRTGARVHITLRWKEDTAPLGYKCAVPDETSTLGNDVLGPRHELYRYSATKAAWFFVSGSANLIDGMLRAAMPMLQAAEALAAPCPRSAAGSSAAGSTPAGASAASPATAADPVGETLVNIFAASDLIDSREFWEHFTSRTGREAHPKSVEDPQLMKELFDAVPDTPAAERIIPSLAVAVTVAAANDRNGHAVFPTLRAAVPVVAQLAADALDDPASERALGRFVALLVNADLAAAR